MKHDWTMIKLSFLVNCRSLVYLMHLFRYCNLSFYTNTIGLKTWFIKFESVTIKYLIYLSTIRWFLTKCIYFLKTFGICKGTYLLMDLRVESERSITKWNCWTHKNLNIIYNGHLSQILCLESQVWQNQRILFFISVIA